MFADWLSNKNTLGFLGVWEQMHNPDFNYGEFAIIMSQAGVRRFNINVKEWVEQTNAIVRLPLKWTHSLDWREAFMSGGHAVVIR